MPGSVATRTAIRRHGWYATAVCGAVRAVVASSLAVGALQAQASPDLARDTSGGLPLVTVGARARVWEQAASDLAVPVAGGVVALTRDSISLRPDGQAAPIAFDRPSVSHVELSLGPQSAPRGTGVLKGLAIGGLGGGVLGVIAGNLTRRNAARFGLYAGGAGGVVGGALGAARPGEEWRRAQFPGVTAFPH